MRLFSLLRLSLLRRALPGVTAASCLALGALAGASAAGNDERNLPSFDASAGAPGGRGLAIRTAKALVSELHGRSAINNALILVKDGRIEAVGPARELSVPEGYEVLDVGAQWVAPGMVDLHSHVGGTRRDINDMVHQTNPGLRVAPTVVPGNASMLVGLSAGVTTTLYIPGSGTNIGGQGVLLKTGFKTYEAMVIRDPGSLKIAQGDNPTRWGFRMGRITMAWNLSRVIREGIAYAKSWEAYERDGSPKPRRDLRLDIFRDLVAKKTQVSTHTQYYHLVLTTITMLARDFGFATYIDHGSFDSYLASPIAQKYGVAAILGPREIMAPRPPRFDTDGQIQGTAWGFQEQGHPLIGFNTDAPVVPQEELPLQAAMGVRYGLRNNQMQGLRGITCVPAVVSGISDRVGSIMSGMDADLLILTGDPIDPRTAVNLVLLEGRPVYDADLGVRRW